MSLVVLDTDVASIACSWGPRKLAHLAEWRRDVTLLPADEVVAMTWGHLRARANARGRPRFTNDTWIAATCIANQLFSPLSTPRTSPTSPNTTV